MGSTKQNVLTKGESLCEGGKESAQHQNPLVRFMPYNVRYEKKYTQIDHQELCNKLERQILRYNLRAAKAEALYSEKKLKKFEETN